MKRLLLILLLLPFGRLAAQVADTLSEVGPGSWEPDTIFVLRTDTLRLFRTDTLHIYHTDTIVHREADTAALKALQEKEVFYREILSANGVDKEKLEAERNYLLHMVDSLRAIVRIALQNKALFDT